MQLVSQPQPNMDLRKQRFNPQNWQQLFSTTYSLTVIRHMGKAKISCFPVTEQEEQLLVTK